MSGRSVAVLAVWPRLAVLLGALVAAAPVAWAVKPAYLAQWPDVARVLADQKGADEPDTWARQMAALNQLDRAIEDMADERRWNQLTADELALRGRYRQASAAIRQQANASLSNELGPGFHWPWEEAPLQAWNSRQWQYESDPAFRRETLSRYLAPELLSELDARKTASDDRAHAAGRQLMEDLGYRESTWSSMGGAGQDAVAMILALLALAVLLMLVRELRRFGLDRKDPKLLRAGFARHPLDFETGVVDRYESEHGGRVERFDLFMGWAWFRVQVGDAHVAIPKGHLATAVNTGGGKRRKFGYVMFVDHDAKSIRPVEWELRRILAPSAWLPLPVACLAGVIGAVSDPVPRAPPLVSALLFAMLAWALTAGIMKWALRRRVRRFVERDAQRIADAAGESAVHPGPPPERDADGKVIQPAVVAS